MNLKLTDRVRFTLSAMFCVICLIVGLWGSLLFITEQTNQNTKQAENNCVRLHTLYKALDQILIDNDARITDAVRTGRITPSEGVIYHRDNTKNRQTLKKGDCRE